MYPNLYYFFKDIFGVELQGLKMINSFGFFVALAFIAAAITLTSELKRKQKLGLFNYTEEKIWVGNKATMLDLFTNFLLGFLIGFKLLGGFFMENAFDNPQGFIFSARGNWFLGLILGGIAAFLKWKEKDKQKLPKPEQRTIRLWPHDRVGDMVVYAAIFGFGGAKLFDILEAPRSFFSMLQAVRDGKQDIASALFSGLTFYGGLIVAGIAIVWYAKRKNIALIHLTDSFAPAMMIAYAVGRIGCQVAGDGDWGIANSAFVSDANGKAILATTEQFNNALQSHSMYLVHKFGSLQNVHHATVQPILGLPNWMFGYTFPHNVGNDGIAFSGCTDQFCNYLPLPVFPTPFYEMLVCGILFFVLWTLRKKIKIPGMLFGIYLIMNGTERFFIEKIRVNATYDWFGFHITQAEIISFLLIIAGVYFVVNSKKWATTA